MNSIIAGMIGVILTAAGLLGLNYYTIVTTSPETSFRGTPVLTAPQGGTGFGSTSASNVGKVLAVADDSPFTWELSAAGSGTVTGSGTLGNCAEWTSATAIGDAGAPCGTGGTSAYDAWTHPASGISATTSQIIISASSTIGDGTLGLTVNGSATTTGVTNIGGFPQLLQAGITSPPLLVTASTTGRSGAILRNYGGGSAPEFRFIVGDPRKTNEYIAFGLTNDDATAGGSLFDLQKKDMAYILTQSRDLAIGTFVNSGLGGSIFFAASSSASGVPQMKIDGNTGRIGIGLATTTVPTSLLTVNGGFEAINATTTNATTTSLAVTNLSAGSCDVKSNGGILYCGTDASSGTSAYDAWTHPISGVSATTSTLRLGGLNASSTVLFDNATSTLFTATTAWLTNLFIGADTIAEYISDTAGAMWTGNTETGISITYQDADNTIDAVCDTASGSVFGCLSTTDWSTFNSKLGSYDAWTHPASAVSATTSSLIVTASSTIGDGTSRGGLTVNGSATTTGTLYIGGYETIPISGVSSPAGMFTASTTGRSGIEMSNEGGGAAPEFRFSITGARSATDYMSFGRTNADATSGGTLAGLNKTGIGYLFDNTRDLVIGAFATGKSIYFGAGDNTGTDAILASTGFFGIGTTSPYAPLSVVGSGGVVAGKYTATSTGTINESAFQNITFVNGTTTSATSTSLFSTTASSTNLFASAIKIANSALDITAARVATLLGSWDFGAADSIEIVNGAGPTVDAIGEVAFDTTDQQLILATTTNASYPAVLPTIHKLWSGVIASTSPDFISGGFLILPAARDAGVIKEIYCSTDKGTSVVINISNAAGSSDTETITCLSSGASDTAITTNNTFAAATSTSLEIGTITGTPDYLNFSVWGVFTRE